MAQTPNELDPGASARHFFGSELRRFRENAGLSQDTLGTLVAYSGDTIGKVEKAVRWPGDAGRFATACDETLGTGGALGRLLPLVLAEHRRETADRAAIRPRPPGPDRLAAAWVAAGPGTPGTAPPGDRTAEDPWHGKPYDPGSTPVDSLLQTAGQTRRAMDRTLGRRTVDEAQLERLDETLLRYRRDYLLNAPLPMLHELLVDFGDVQALSDERQPAVVQRRLSRAAAFLAVLTADALMRLGCTREARAWYGTARTAADDTGEAQLRALVRAQETMLSYYYGSPEETVRLARQAQAVADDAPGSATALAAAAEARALARHGDAAGSESAMRQAQRLFDAMPTDDRDDLAMNFSERRLCLYLSGTLTALGERRRAEEVQRQALSLSPPGFCGIDPALIRLDQAVCAAQERSVGEACQLAEETVLGLPPAHRTRLVLVRVQELLHALPPHSQRHRAVTRLREALALDAGGL